MKYLIVLLLCLAVLPMSVKADTKYQTKVIKKNKKKSEL